MSFAAASMAMSRLVQSVLDGQHPNALRPLDAAIWGASGFALCPLQHGRHRPLSRSLRAYANSDNRSCASHKPMSWVLACRFPNKARHLDQRYDVGSPLIFDRLRHRRKDAAKLDQQVAYWV